jgi:hypothetical protein
MTKDAPTIALAYALWDSRHSVRLEHPEDVADHEAEAREVRRWLKVHGYDLKRVKRQK